MESSRMDKNAMNRARSDLALKIAFLELFDEEAERLSTQPLSPAAEHLMRQAFARSEKRMLRTLRRGVSRSGFRRSPLRSLAKTAAALALILCLGGATAFAALPSFRAQIYRLLLHVTPEYTALNMQERPGPGQNWQGACYPSVIPEGMRLVKAQADAFESFMLYEDASGHFFTFSEKNPATECNVDTEDADIRYETVNGHPAMVAVMPDTCAILWSETDRYFVLYSNLGPETLLQVARGVTSGK